MEQRVERVWKRRDSVQGKIKMWIGNGGVRQPYDRQKEPGKRDANVRSLSLDSKTDVDDGLVQVWEWKGLAEKGA